ncbi:MAG TPA: hypothetical protein VGK00_14500 [Anaerolineales bacterium]|jgi:hypothetical protein
MKNRDDLNLIDNEVKRVQIQNHANFGAWLESLQPHARAVVDKVLEDDVTPELIYFAQDAPEAEWDEFDVLRIVGGGNPDPYVALSLTNVTLGEMLYEVRNFGIEDRP